TVLVVVDADPGRSRAFIVEIDDGVVPDKRVSGAQQGDAVPMIGHDEVVLDQPVHESTVEATDALQRPAVRLLGVFVVDEGVAPEHDTDHFSRADTIITYGPRLAAVVVVVLYGIAILHGIVLKYAEIGASTEPVAREVLDEIAFDE